VRDGLAELEVHRLDHDAHAALAQRAHDAVLAGEHVAGARDGRVLG